MILLLLLILLLCMYMLKVLSLNRPLSVWMQHSSCYTMLVSSPVADSSSQHLVQWREVVPSSIVLLWLNYHICYCCYHYDTMVLLWLPIIGIMHPTVTVSSHECLCKLMPVECDLAPSYQSLQQYCSTPAVLWGSN